MQEQQPEITGDHSVRFREGNEKVVFTSLFLRAGGEQLLVTLRNLSLRK